MTKLVVTFKAEYSKHTDGYKDLQLAVHLSADATHTEITEAYVSFLRALGYYVEGLEVVQNDTDDALFS